MSTSASMIDWSVSADHSELVLNVSFPDGSVETYKFKGGQKPSFRLSDLGKNAQEGTYRYDLLLVPRVSAATSAKLKAARAAGDEKAAAKAQKEAGLDKTIVQSGSFSLVGGAFVLDAEEGGNGNARSQGTTGDASTETGTPRVGGSTKKSWEQVVQDQVIPDDLIVQGSTCVGFDCVNNESFGFDTIRLKENNTRIKFEDTSVGSFPTNDWQLTANDSASGGSSKFSIEDITGSRVPFTITAGASTNSIFVDSTGRVGMRTSTPVLDLHINTSNTPAIRLEQNSSGGFTAQTWDVGANEANFFVRDVTSGSRLPLRIRPGAPTSSLDISADGDVGIGTASPDELLHVSGGAEDANTISLVQNTSASGLSSAAVQSSRADVAITSLIAHGSARTLSRFGQTLGGFSEVLNAAGDGLIVGTLGATPLILGTNSVARMTISSTGAVTIPGSLTVTGTKNFGVPDPSDSSKAIYFSALEGPEAGTYYRGTAKTVNGEATITMPGHFARMTEKERMTVQLTPIGAPGQLYVASRSPEKIVIKVAEGSSDLEFDYLVQGVRRGYLDFQVERENNLTNPR